MKKTIIQGLGWLIVLLTATNLSAKTPVYFFYDPACMQQLEYERINRIDDLAHTDYYTSVSPNKQLIFSVHKNAGNLNKELVSEIPEKPYMCADRGAISPALIKEINNNRRIAYMVVQTGMQYALYPIYSIASLEQTAKGLVYTDPTYGFHYDANVSKPGEILNHGANKERNVFFETQTTTACLPTYEFKIISRHIETPIKHLTLVQGLGFQRLHTTIGELRLTHVNGAPVSQVIAGLCNTNSAPSATNPNEGGSESAGLPDTVGLSPIEKKLWASRQKDNTTPRKNYVKPVSMGQDGIPAQGVLARGNDKNPTTANTKLLPGGIYIVQEKETLYTLSEKFNVSVERLMTINNLQGFELGLNQPLKVVDDGSVPVQSKNPLVEITDNGTTKTTIHVVEQGDTLYSISKQYGITLRDVYKLNSNLTNEYIDINQRIVVGYQPI
ncbi:MAG: LysM peptidoglycan-binding domain-containing protein [Aureispira sp.]